MIGRLLAQVLGTLLIFALLLAGVGLVCEAALRYRRFGVRGLVHPLEFSATSSSRGVCGGGDRSDGPFAPHCRGRSLGSEIVTNSRGRNDREVDEARPHYRVLVAGDSISVAAGVAPREAYHAVLEERLDRELGRPGFVELYNDAFGGTSTSHYVKVLERALERGPLDAVLIGVSVTDLLEDVVRPHTCRPGDEAFHISKEEKAFHRRGVMGRNEMAKRLAHWEASSGLWIFNWLAGRSRAFAVSRYDDPRRDERMASIEGKAREMYRSCALRMREIADGTGVDLAWAVLAYRPSKEGDAIVGVLRSLDEPVVTFFDTHERFAAPEEMTIFPGDEHPNAAVHALYAERLYEAMVELGWLDRIRRADAATR